MLPVGSVVLDDVNVAMKPRKLDRSARLAPVLQINSMAGPIREPMQAATLTLHQGTATPSPAQSDTDRGSAAEQDSLGPAVGGLTARCSPGHIADDSAGASPNQPAAAEAAQGVQPWVPVPVPRIVAVLQGLQVSRHHAEQYSLFPV